jgi:hypothetical protein
MDPPSRAKTMQARMIYGKGVLAYSGVSEDLRDWSGSKLIVWADKNERKKRNIREIYDRVIAATSYDELTSQSDLMEGKL